MCHSRRPVLTKIGFISPPESQGTKPMIREILHPRSGYFSEF